MIKKYSFEFVLLLLLFMTVKLNAENPIVQTAYTADAASLVYQDRFYVYAGIDEASPTGRWFNMREWRVYSSSDMVNWTDHGSALRATDFKWASGDAWASQCVFRKGKFYWYVSVSHKEKGGKAIGVAVSDSPTGPFVDAIGSALITTDMTPKQGDFDDIDPTVFVDNDGQAYLYWGNGKCKYVKLNDDMISFSDSIHYASVPKFGEAPWLQKINNCYYLSYSSSSPSTIEYCTGSSAVGPWVYQNRILNTVENCPTSHQAISAFKGHWYLVYHNGTLNGGGGFRRSVCIEEFTLNQDGTIPLIQPTKQGVLKSLKKLNPFVQVEAETMAWSVGVETKFDADNSGFLTKIDPGDYIKIRDVDFGKGAKSFICKVRSEANGGKIEVRIGNVDGPLLGICPVDKSTGSSNWTMNSIKINKTKGMHDLYLVFKGAGNNLFQLDWWKLK